MDYVEKVDKFFFIENVININYELFYKLKKFIKVKGNEITKSKRIA